MELCILFDEDYLLQVVCPMKILGNFIKFFAEVFEEFSDLRYFLITIRTLINQIIDEFLERNEYHRYLIVLGKLKYVFPHLHI